MRKEKIIAGNYYHVYNRGVNFENIFFQIENWHFFLRRLKKYFTPDNASIIVYCLMPNHYHLLLLAQTEDFGIKVMHPFAIAYTKAINKQQGRVGPIFQGPFQARRLKTIEELLNLSRYIHLNPVMAGFVQKSADWEFSSYQEYIGKRKGTFLMPEVILEQFDGQDAYTAYVADCGDHRLPEKVLFD